MLRKDKTKPKRADKIGSALCAILYEVFGELFSTRCALL